MNTNKRRLTSREAYIEEFKLNLRTLENTAPECLFDEWPVDVRFSHKEPIFEEFAKVFLNYPNGPKAYLDKIKATPRDKGHPYNQNHSGIQSSGITGNLEDIESKALFNYHKLHEQDNFNIRIIDYQTPLRPRQVNSGIGKIDILGVDDKNVYLLEAKKIFNPNGTILHAVLEVYTYFRFLNESFDRIKDEFSLSENLNIVPAIIFYRDSVTHREFLNPYCKSVRLLMNELGVHAFLIDYKGDAYTSDREAVKEYIDNNEIKVLPSRDITIKHIYDPK